MTHTVAANENSQLPGWLVTLLHFLVVAALPLLLVMVNARLLMSPAFLRFEYYQRPNFPPDTYGFTADERMQYGSLGMLYLFNDNGPEFLSELTFEDGSPLFIEREVSHMTDVKNVTRRLSVFGYSLIAVYAAGVVLLASNHHTRPTLYAGLLTGGLLTAALIVVGLIVTATSFNWLFTQFHGLFFEGTSWIFRYSDTLIRLYPEVFWVDAFAVMFGGALLEAMVLSGIMWWQMRK